MSWKIHGSWARTTILSRTLSEMSRKRLVVISDLGFSCKLRVKQLHLLDIFLYRSTRRILDRVGSIVTLRIRSLQIGGESHESTMDLAQGLNRQRSASAYRFSNGGCNQDENQLKRNNMMDRNAFQTNVSWKLPPATKTFILFNLELSDKCKIFDH